VAGRQGDGVTDGEGCLIPFITKYLAIQFINSLYANLSNWLVES